ncbi:odorant receptor 46a-like [Leptopilina boulardi]|uniref:odorant receptor 46a-like n=1 Tax=Leptopilina boulardi TaxID=63433 RepID=UPI0021F5C7BC|nr:odorant receptor 46a-like [Leptopilina boulardi]
MSFTVSVSLSIEMEFSLHIMALFYCGVWNENIKYPLLYIVYKIIVLSIVCLFSISLFTECIRNYGSNDDNSIQGLFIAVPFFAAVLKLIIFYLFPKKVKKLIKLFKAKICQPNSDEEWIIWNAYKKSVDSMFWIIFIFTLLSGSALLILPLIDGELRNFILPFKTYQPFEIINFKLYILTYLWQILASFYGILFNVTSDTFAYGTITLLCGQYDIYCLRLSKIGNETKCYSIKYYVDHYSIIQKFIWYAQDFFMMGITPLFCFSLITLAATILNVVQVNLFSAKFVTMLIFLLCMLTQIFLYCWFGNFLIDKSQEVTNIIYNCNWIDLTNVEKKSLKFLMQFSGKGNVFSYHGQCILNLNTFVWIVKASYTALNVLKRSAN